MTNVGGRPRRPDVIPVVVRVAILTCITAFGIWVTVGAIREQWPSTLITACIGTAFGAVAIRYGPKRPLTQNVVWLTVFGVMLALVALREVVGGVALMWLFSAAVGMNLGSGGWVPWRRPRGVGR
jgi:hypothetical protein